MVREKGVVRKAKRHIGADSGAVVSGLRWPRERGAWGDINVKFVLQFIRGEMWDLSNRVTCLEDLKKHSVSLEAAQQWQAIEWYYASMRRHYEKDAIPGAGSAESEWQKGVEKVAGTVGRMLGVFDDLEERLQCHIDLIGQLKELFQLAGSMGGRDLEEAVLVLHDAVYGVYSEKLTRKQFEVVKGAVESLRGVEWDRSKVRHLQGELRKWGFETVPSDRFVNLYDERGVGRREATVP